MEKRELLERHPVSLYTVGTAALRDAPCSGVVRQNLAIATCVALALAAPAPAIAARAEVVRTASSPPGDDGRFTRVFSTIHFDAAPGERNAVTVTRTSDGAEIRDDGAPIEPGNRCTAIDEHAVRCLHVREATVNGIAEGVELRLGDGDDALSGTGIRAYGDDGDDALTGGWSLNGGAGNDVLTGTSSSEVLNGGPGSDQLHGGAGADSVNGGDPDDAPAPDLLDGGTGSDTVSYQGRAAPVTVDLATTSAGADREADTLAGIESIGGGTGPDELRGDAGANRIDGGGAPGAAGDDIDGRGGSDQLDGSRADDVIAGGAGDDEIDGGGGSDRLSGGDGDDVFDLMLDRRGTDTVECGRGRDRIDEPFVLHVIAPDCEVIWLLLLDARITPVRDGRPDAQTFRIEPTPSRSSIPPECIRIRLGEPAGSFGSAIVRMPRRGRTHVRVPLTPRGRRKVRSGARVRARFKGYLDCGRGRPRGRNGFGGYTFVA
jgi:hypothetical protein